MASKGSAPSAAPTGRASAPRAYGISVAPQDLARRLTPSYLPPLDYISAREPFDYARRALSGEVDVFRRTMRDLSNLEKRVLAPPRIPVSESAEIAESYGNPFGRFVPGSRYVH